MRSKSAHVRRVKRRRRLMGGRFPRRRAPRVRAGRWHEAGTIHRWCMMRVTQAIGAVVVILGTAPLTPAAAQSSNFFALNRFNQQIASYMTIRNEVQDRVGVPQTSSNSTDIVVMQSALAHGIRKARPRAQAGDIFNADVGYEFRRSHSARVAIARCFRRRVAGRSSARLSGLAVHAGGQRKLRLEIRRDDATRPSLKRCRTCRGLCSTASYAEISCCWTSTPD